MPIDPLAFKFVAELVRREAAIVLEPGKEYLVESRLMPVARREKYADLDAFFAAVMRSPEKSPLRYLVVDALTTNETLFFRDFHPFEALRTTVLPDLIPKRAHVRKLNIWSAAASTGQEAYTIAMLIREHFPELANWDVKILGTDLSQTTLAQARSGSYSQLEVNRGLPALYLAKYFTQCDDRWLVKEELRRMVEFKSMNLAQPWPVMPPFDLIFIRNVLIYFDQAMKTNILKRMHGCLHPHGLLFLGTAETTINLDPSWAPVKVGATVAFRHIEAQAVAPPIKKAA